MSPSRPSVTIVGAGIAGMSAALRLVQAGCPVTVLEKSPRIGGQFGAVKEGPRYHEHASHILADWCRNFFALCKEIGLKHPPDPPENGEPDKYAAFEAQPVFLTLQPLSPGRATRAKGRDASDFKRLEYLGASQYFWKNASAGVAHWSDMAIYQYSVLDLLSDDSLDDDQFKEFLNRVSVNGFMHSRCYASDIAALLHHELLLKVFAVPSYRTSARSYQTYLRHMAAFPPGQKIAGDRSDLSPSFWAMRGNVHDTFWEPFERAVKRAAEKNGVSFRIRRDAEVTSVTVAGGKVTQIHVGKRPEEIDGPLLLAVPPAGLKAILQKSPALAKAAPDLVDVGYLEAVPVPALNLYFNKDLKLPKEHMTLLDASDDFYDPDSSLARKNGIASKYGLSLVDHSQLWPELPKGKTVLSVLAADAKLLMEEPDDTITRRILDVLKQYIRFDDRDIEHAHLQNHAEEPLFVNTEGSWEYRPEARLDEGARMFPRVHDRTRNPVSNLFMAGDYCRSEVDIVSLEGAMVTGISAARLICDQVKLPIGRPEFDRDQVRQAKVLVDPWIDLAARRSHRNFSEQRQRVARIRKAL
jgi:uncharacterized protein with NAD-binding domain and iron-sulfur cluster